jgi:hypothetical protein
MAGIGLSADGAQIAGYVGENTCSSAGVPPSSWSSGKKLILEYGPRLPAGMDALGVNTDGAEKMMNLMLADASLGDPKQRKKAWGYAKCLLKALEMAATSALAQHEDEAPKEEDEAAKEEAEVAMQEVAGSGVDDDDEVDENEDDEDYGTEDEDNEETDADGSQADGEAAEQLFEEAAELIKEAELHKKAELHKEVKTRLLEELKVAKEKAAAAENYEEALHLRDQIAKLSRAGGSEDMVRISSRSPAAGALRAFSPTPHSQNLYLTRRAAHAGALCGVCGCCCCCGGIRASGRRDRELLHRRSRAWRAGHLARRHEAHWPCA